MTAKELEISKMMAELRTRNARLALPTNFVPKLPLYSHQIMGLHYGIRLPNLGLFYEQGLGKTAIAINIMRYRIEAGQVNKILVVAPKNVLCVWEKEVEKNSNLRSVILHEQSRNERRQKFKEEAEFYIINYEAVSLFFNDILMLNPTGLILDESTRIKNVKTQRTKAILKISEFVPYKLILTGTPLTNSPMDIFCQIQALDPSIFNNVNFWQWRSFYFKDIGKYYPKWIPKQGTIENLHKKIYTIGIRYTKEECLDLPKKIYQNLYIEMNSQQKEVYERIKNRLLVSLEEKKVTTNYIITQLLKLSQIESGWLKTDIIRDENGKVEEEGEIFDLGKNTKIEALTELLEDLLYENKKVVIWTKFRHSLKLIETLLKEKKIGYVTCHGDVKENEKRTAVSDFQSKSNIKVFLSQIRAGAFGTTLTAADTAIYFELDDDVELYEQSQDRNHRIGSEQHSSIVYIHLLVKDGVGEKTLAALKNKKKLSNLIVESLVVPSTNVNSF